MREQIEVDMVHKRLLAGYGIETPAARDFPMNFDDECKKIGGDVSYRSRTNKPRFDQLFKKLA